MKLEIGICEHWNGKDNVCDSVRFKEWLDECNNECYHKPFKINDKRITAVDGILILLKEKSVGV